MEGFTGSDYYAQVRTLKCGERVRLANSFLRFSGLDLRPLLAGSADCSWDEKLEYFSSRGQSFDEAAVATGGAKILEASSADLESYIHALLPDNQLLFLCQGERIGGLEFVTEIAIYRSHLDRLVFSELRQGREGFEFEFDLLEIKRRFSLAAFSQITIFNRFELTAYFSADHDWQKSAIAKHNEGLANAYLQDIVEQMRDFILQDPKTFLIQDDQHPTYFALKFCGPICWYFNPIVQTVYGIQAQKEIFRPKQLEFARRIDHQSQICRNLGLLAGKANSEAYMIKLKKALLLLIDLAEGLKSLSV